MDINKLVQSAMDAPAPDDEVAVVCAVYLDGVASGDPRDPEFENAMRDHLAGTEFEGMI